MEKEFIFKSQPWHYLYGYLSVMFITMGTAIFLTALILETFFIRVTYRGFGATMILIWGILMAITHRTVINSYTIIIGEDDMISFLKNGKLFYKGHIRNLIKIKSHDINKWKIAYLSFIFKDKKIIFNYPIVKVVNIFKAKVSPNQDMVNTYTEMLRYFIEKYKLTQENKSKSVYFYINNKDYE